MSHKEGNNGIGSLIIMGLIIYGGVQLWNYIFSDTPKNSYQNSSYSDSYSRPSSYKHKEDCVEPENPYDEGSGHYAGFQWGEDGKTCGGNSSSFIEGCEEYETQEEAYNTCESNN
jgi:hypothetical protein